MPNRFIRHSVRSFGLVAKAEHPMSGRRTLGTHFLLGFLAGAAGAEAAGVEATCTEASGTEADGAEAAGAEAAGAEEASARAAAFSEAVNLASLTMSSSSASSTRPFKSSKAFGKKCQCLDRIDFCTKFERHGCCGRSPKFEKRKGLQRFAYQHRNNQKRFAYQK